MQDNTHDNDLRQWQHQHQFHVDNSYGERGTRRVIVLTVVMMLVEIGAGVAYGSMSLLADGWHMGTHAAALGITAFAYWYTRQHKDNPLYSFGTGKVGVLGGYTSAVVLAVVALLMLLESLQRFLSPVEIHFNEAIGVAVLGLLVNLVSAAMLHSSEAGHAHAEADDHHRIETGQQHAQHHDHNLRAAYLHVMADALTSILAIVALVTGKLLGWVWMDPMMGIIGAILITRWSWGLLRDTSKVLLDSTNTARAATIRQTIESDPGNRVADLHLWQVGSNQYALIVSVVTQNPQPPSHYKVLLQGFSELAHISIEVNPLILNR